MKTNVFKQILLILLTIISCILGKGENSAMSLMVFITSFLFLLYSGKVYAFFFAFLVHINISQTINFSWTQAVSVIAILSIAANSKDIRIIQSDRGLRKLLLISLLFSGYVLVISLLGNGASPDQIIRSAGFFSGFLVLLPTYLLILRRRQEFFETAVAAAATFVVFYYLNIIYQLGYFNLTENVRSGYLEVQRLMGYDVRQFVIFFFYLIPATAYMNLSIAKKTLLITIGVFAYFVLVLAVYRLAMFYVVMGSFTALIFIAKYVKWSKLVVRVAFMAGILLVIASNLESFVKNYSDIITWTLESLSGKSTDSSGSARLYFQLPILLKYIQENFFLGVGLPEILARQSQGMYGFVDIPVVGTLAAFGMIGMVIYYWRFFFIFSTKVSKLSPKALLRTQKNELFLLLTLRAYFISMLVFRIFYVSWELTFSYQQAEFGLLVGAYFALYRMMKDFKLRMSVNTTGAVQTENFNSMRHRAPM